MEPIEYCRLYVKSRQPTQRGYRAACVRTLVEATFETYTYQTIDKNWGSQFEKRPDAVLALLKAAHIMNQLGQTLDEIYPKLTSIVEQVSQVAPYKKHK